MRACIAAVAVIAVLAVAAPAFAAVNINKYNTTDCTGASTVKSYATGSCIVDDSDSSTRGIFSCNDTTATAKLFAGSDSSCATPLFTVSFKINVCDKTGSSSSEKITCSAGAVAFAAVAVVAAVLAMLI
jgi:hypothetical protein